MAKPGSDNPARSDDDHLKSVGSTQDYTSSTRNSSETTPNQTQSQNSYDREAEARGFIAQISLGRPEALRGLFDLYSDELLRLAQAITGSLDLASDVVQELFIELWSRGPSIEIHGSILGYLWNATRNRARKFVRYEMVRQRYQASVQSDYLHQHHVSSNSAPEQIAAEELAARINNLLGELPQRCRDIFLLRWRDGMTVDEIADIYEIGKPTVRNQFGRAVKHLAAALKLDG